MPQKIITIDCDGVLSATAESFLAYYDYTIKGTQVSVEDIHNHLFHLVPKFNLSQKEAFELWDTFFHTVAIKKFLPEPGARDAIKQLKKNDYTLYIVTWRREGLRERTMNWIQYWYPGMFEDVIFANDFTDDYISKWTLCTWLHADIHIDDHIIYAQETHDHWVHTLLLDKPWNRKEDITQYDDLYRMDNRSSVYNYIIDNA